MNIRENIQFIQRIAKSFKVSPYPWHFTAAYPFYARNPSLKNHTGMKIGPIKQKSTTKHTIKVLFFGDIITAQTAPEVDDNIQALFTRADLVVGNLEGPLIRSLPKTSEKNPWVIPIFLDYFQNLIYNLKVDNRKLILSVANNHAQDLGDAGLTETLALLDTLKITSIGAMSKGKPAIFQTSFKKFDLSLAVVAWTHWLNKRPHNQGFAAPKQFGVLEKQNLNSYLNKLPEVDCLIAMPHWEYEYQHFPVAKTRAFAQELSKKGFQLICGCHPHVLQPLEQFPGSVCLYSVGNFVRNTHKLTASLANKIGALWEVEISADQQTKGQVAGYTIHPFFHDRNRHTLQLVDDTYQDAQALLWQLFLPE